MCIFIQFIKASSLFSSSSSSSICSIFSVVFLYTNLKKSKANALPPKLVKKKQYEVAQFDDEEFSKMMAKEMAGFTGLK